MVLGAITYMFTAAESPEDYIEKIDTERERQYKYIPFNVESPLTEEQKLIAVHQRSKAMEK